MCAGPSSSDGPQPDLVIETTSAVLSAVARGDSNLNTAVMSGSIKVVGDMAFLLVLRAMIDGASVSHGV
jgi:putative sterol carrier protein